MVGLVALLVLGPEKLPKAARLTGLWVGKARNMMATAKAEIQHELHAAEMRELMQQQALTSELHNVLSETQSAVEDINFSLTAVSEAEHQDDNKPASS